MVASIGDGYCRNLVQKSWQRIQGHVLLAGVRSGFRDRCPGAVSSPSCPVPSSAATQLMEGKPDGDGLHRGKSIRTPCFDLFVRNYQCSFWRPL